MHTVSGGRRQAAFLLAAVLLVFTFSQAVVIAQNLGTAPQHNVAVQGQTGAQPEGALLNAVNWIGNVIAPIGAGLSLVGSLVAYLGGRGAMRYVVVAIGCLTVSGATRLLEFWINQGGGGVS